MSRDLVPVPSVVVGEVLGAPGDLLDAAVLVAEREGPVNTRRAYKAAYRDLAAFLAMRAGRSARVEDLDAAAVAAYRDHLARQGRATATVSARLSAVRKLAYELNADGAIQRVKTPAPGDPVISALTHAEYERILKAPDARTTRGLRDIAILHVLGDAGLRRAECAALSMDDIVRRRRQREGRTWPAIAPKRADRSDYELLIRDAKGGKGRAVPLSRPALKALIDWQKQRPPADTDAVFVSMPRNGQTSSSLSPGAIGGVVSKHAKRAGLADCTAHTLRHTFCTLLAERDVSIEVIRELAGHADIRTTQRYITVSEQRRDHAITHTFEDGRRDWQREQAA